MKSLHMRIIVTFSIAFFFSSLVLGWTWLTMDQSGMRMMNESSQRLTLLQAQEAYEKGGPPALSRFLAETDSLIQGKRYLTDSSGRDLVTGADLSAMKASNFSPLWNAISGLSRKDLDIISSPGNRYRLIVVATPPRTSDRLHLYVFIIPFGIALLGWSLSIGIVSPLLRLANTVDRFGRGDLSARVHSNRKDEIGNLARSFNKMADKIETLLTAERRLLQDVSHELRSPLMRLSFAAELMKNSADPEAAAQRMRREIARLSALVGSLLEVVGSEGDSSSRSIQRVKIVPLVEDIVGDGRFEAEARNVQIDAQINSSAIIQGNAELLRRAIENVLRNAIRFAHASSQVLLRVEDNSGSTTISVRDFGPGVPDEFLGRIFDPLFRVDESRDRAAGGIGLGLSIARRAILLHHGEVTAENAHPGLCVRITLPAVFS
jgi:two-component system sensor histidine kinase CpxA